MHASEDTLLSATNSLFQDKNRGDVLYQDSALKIPLCEGMFSPARSKAVAVITLCTIWTAKFAGPRQRLVKGWLLFIQN